jgi:hypothetical protein
MCARSPLPERLRGLAERLRPRETDVVEEMLLAGQFAESLSLVPALGPNAQDARRRKRSP